MVNPRLTALEPPDPTPFISYCLDWMFRPGENWKGPLLMQPAEVPLLIRESTAPASTGPGKGGTRSGNRKTGGRG